VSKNVTLRLDEGVLRKAKHLAVEHDQSLSQWVAQLIAKAVTNQESFEEARARALKRIKKGYHLGGRAAKRNDLHGR